MKRLMTVRLFFDAESPVHERVRAVRRERSEHAVQIWSRCCEMQQRVGQHGEHVDSAALRVFADVIDVANAARTERRHLAIDRIARDAEHPRRRRHVAIVPRDCRSDRRSLDVL